MIGARATTRRNPTMVTPRHLIAFRTRIARRHRPRPFTVIPNPRSHPPHLNPAGYVIKDVAPRATGGNEPSKPINRPRIPCKKLENTKMANDLNDLDDRERTPSEAGALPVDLDDQNSPAAKAPSIDHEARGPSATETSKTNHLALPFDRSAVTPGNSDLDSSAPSNAKVTTPPNVHSAPKVRPVRHRPIMGCALPSPATTVTLIADPLRGLQSYIGIRPANVDALAHRQMLARDLRLGPHLYHWLVFGLAPGSLVPNILLAGGEDDSSEDRQSIQV